MTDLDDILAKRPVDRAVVDAHKTRMLEQVRAYRLKELREELHLQDRVGKGPALPPAPA